MKKKIEFTKCCHCPHVLIMIDGRGFCEEQAYKFIALHTIDEDCTLEDAPDTCEHEWLPIYCHGEILYCEKCHSSKER